MIELESRADAGRVHAVGRFRGSLAQLSLPTPDKTSFNLHLAGWRADYHHGRDSDDAQGSHHSSRIRHKLEPLSVSKSLTTQQESNAGISRRQWP